MIEFYFFGMQIKTLGSLGKIRVGRVTGNTHISFFGLYYKHYIPTNIKSVKQMMSQYSQTRTDLIFYVHEPNHAFGLLMTY